MAELQDQEAKFGDTDNTLLLKAATALQAVASGGAGDAVLYTAQTKTAAEQLIARKNLGALSQVTLLGDDGSQTVFPPAADTNAARGTALQAAKTAAASGDTIFVGPGTYDTNNLLKNGVNWDFAPGAKVNFTGTSDTAIFDDGPNGTNGAVTCVIRGDSFRNTGAPINPQVGAWVFGTVINQTNAGSFITIYSNLLSDETTVITPSNEYPVAIWAGKGRMEVHSNRILSTNGSPVYWERGRCDIYAFTIEAISNAVGQAVVGNVDANADAINGALWIRANSLLAPANGLLIQWIASTQPTAQMWIEAFEFRGGNSLFLGSGGKVYLTANKFGVLGGVSPTDGRIQIDTGLVWITCQKNASCNIAISGGSLEYTSQEFLDDVGNTAEMVKLTNDSDTSLCVINGGQWTAATSKGFSVGTGCTLRLNAPTINTAAVATTSPITKSGGTCVLGAGTTLVANVGADSIAAGTAQNIVSYSAYSNRAANANVTVLVGPFTVDTNVI